MDGWDRNLPARCQLETLAYRLLNYFAARRESAQWTKSLETLVRTLTALGRFQTERVSFYPSNSGRVAWPCVSVLSASSVNYQRREGKRTALMCIASSPLMDQSGKLGSGPRERHRLTRRLATEAVSNCVLRLPSGSEAPERDRFSFDLGNLSAPALRLGSKGSESDQDMSPEYD